MQTISITQGARSLSLDGADLVYAEEALALRGYAPSVSYKGRDAYMSTPPREVELTVKVRTRPYSACEDICSIGARSLAGEQTWLHVDEWRQRVVIASVTAETITPGVAAVKLLVTLLDGAWRRDGETQSYALGQQNTHDVEGDWLDYPHDMPYDYGAPPEPTQLYVQGAAASDTVWLRIVFRGPCTHPAVQIGGNIYEWRGDLVSSEFVVIDPIDHTALRYDAHSLRGPEDAFAGVVRGTGVGGGNYAFEPQPIRYVDGVAQPLTISTITACVADITPIYKGLYAW